MLKNNILISGTSSGLGKFLSKKLGGYKLIRKKNFSFYEKKKWDLIIHCGFYTGNDLKKSFENIKLSYLISKLESKKTIFISSMLIHDKKNNSLYKKSKQICELFYCHKKDYVIRLGSLIGNEMRKNTIHKILFTRSPKIGLTHNSKYSFIHYNEVLQLIILLIKQDKKKHVNFYRHRLFSIDQIANKFNKKVKYGNFFFKCTTLKSYPKTYFNNIIKNKTSLDVLKEFKNFRRSK